MRFADEMANLAPYCRELGAGALAGAPEPAAVLEAGA